MTGIDNNKKVEVYFNLHKKCWSIRQAGKPVVHADFVEIKEPQFVVQQGGNARVRREKRKNVHAGISGYIDHLGMGSYGSVGVPVTYNPYNNETFIEKDSKKPIYHSNYAKLEPKQVFASYAL